MISESTMPTKSELIQICRKDYNLDHSKLGFNGIAVLKDRVIMAIYIAEMLK